MEKLSSQDAGFLKIESPHCPFHVAGLMILKLPDSRRGDYMARLVRKCGRLNELWPAFNKKLCDPVNMSAPAWVPAADYDPAQHVLHYALPAPGHMRHLLRLVTRAHERPLDRSRPLWELHVIEGLGGGRFALYCKVHHALVDGVGAMKMMQSLLSTSPEQRLRVDRAQPPHKNPNGDHSLFQALDELRRGLRKQYRAIPELSRLLAHMGADAIQGKTDVMRLPFTAPRTIFNCELDSSRAIAICELSLASVRKIARQAGGSINDVLLSVCGGALRRYLQGQKSLPEGSLVAGMPVSLKTGADSAGNKLSYIIAPFFTDESNDWRRLKRVIKVTRAAKGELGQVSTTAAEDYYALLMAPTLLLTLTGNATLLRPGINAIFSNVPGARGDLYLEGARLQALYPLSIVTDGMGLNITVVSHAGKLCFAIISCPIRQPGIADLGKMIKESFGDLRAAACAVGVSGPSATA